MSIRIFNRLEFARMNLSFGIEPHTFFLDKMDYLQRSNKGSFISGPMIYAEKCKDEYDYWCTLQKIDYGMNYFMRPYTLTAFGCNEKDTSKNYLLNRVYLQHLDGKNHVLVTTERINLEDISKYLSALNYETIWKSSLLDCMNTNKIQQTLIRKNNPYKGYYNTILELK